MITAATARYIDTAEVAKMLRPALKKAFPSVKFSVCIERYAGGSSIDVGWTDGPTEAQVREVTRRFAGGRFEGMTDCAYSADSWYCPKHGARVAQTQGCDVASNNGVHQSRCCANAELVHFGASYVHGNRTASAEFRAELRATVLRECGLPAEAGDQTLLPEGSVHQFFAYATVTDAVSRLSHQSSR